MDIVKKMILSAARAPRSENAELLLSAVNYIETLHEEVRNCRDELARATIAPREENSRGEN